MEETKEKKKKEILKKELKSQKATFDLKKATKRKKRFSAPKDFNFDPLCGTPKEVQAELDFLALYLQKNPENEFVFAKIQQYINKYLLGLVFKKYSFVKGYEQSDMYQEALIALYKKAIPNFNKNKGMSFLNFAKMCINRHLITILHASKNRRKDLPINNSISLDYSPPKQEESGGKESVSLINAMGDKKNLSPDKKLASGEAYVKTLEMIIEKLSSFETIVLEEYLQEKSYKETALNVTRRTGINYNEKSIDNALLRIRKKANELLKECGVRNIPLFT